MIFESRRLSGVLAELLVIAFFIFGMVVNEISRRKGFVCFRLLIIVFIIMMASLSSFYRDRSKNLSIGVTEIVKDVEYIDIFNAICAILSNLAVFGICYLFYNPEWFNHSVNCHKLLSCLYILSAYIAGNYLAYYNRTYKQNLRKFSFIALLKAALSIAPFFLLFIEKICGGHHHLIVSFPYYFVFTLGFFRIAFSECTNIKYTIFLILTIISLIYFSYDIVVRFNNLGILRI